MCLGAEFGSFDAFVQVGAEALGVVQSEAWGRKAEMRTDGFSGSKEEASKGCERGVQGARRQPQAAQCPLCGWPHLKRTPVGTVACGAFAKAPQKLCYPMPCRPDAHPCRRGIRRRRASACSASFRRSRRCSPSKDAGCIWGPRPRLRRSRIDRRKSGTKEIKSRNQEQKVKSNKSRSSQNEKKNRSR
jgi:hypothetical protein